ncbi:MAG: AraC family transcriptional regulator [Bacteroidaceae bacterium]|nr:AraC family transcriptional regulator [Bacteroidaceae bacterium]
MGQIETSILFQDIIFLDDVRKLTGRQCADYFLHIFVIQGSLRFRVGDNEFLAKANDGVILIEGKPVCVLDVSEDLLTTVLLLSNKYLQVNMPKISFNVKGLTFYHERPIMSMNNEDMKLCLSDLEDIRRRLSMEGHIYFKEVLMRSIDNFTYDIFDIYTRCNQEQTSKGGQESIITQHFINLLEENVLHDRTVEFYADKLCVTPKYLSRVCLQSTGHTASYWIAQFALTRMLEMLTDTDKSLTEISNEVNFQSLSHFTRFVKKHTGLTPSEYRMKKGKG